MNNNDHPKTGKQQIADAISANLVDKNKIFATLNEELQTPAPVRRRRFGAPLRAAMSMAAMLLLTVAVLLLIPPPAEEPTPSSECDSSTSATTPNSQSEPVTSQSSPPESVSSSSSGSHSYQGDSSSSDSSDNPPVPLSAEESALFLEFAGDFNLYCRIATNNMTLQDEKPAVIPDSPLNLRTNEQEIASLTDIRVLLDKLFVSEVATYEYYRLTEGENPRYTETGNGLLMDVSRQTPFPLLLTENAMSVKNEPFRMTLRVLVSDPRSPNQYYTDFSFRKISGQWVCTEIPSEIVKSFDS